MSVRLHVGWLYCSYPVTPVVGARRLLPVFTQFHESMVLVSRVFVGQTCISFFVKERWIFFVFSFVAVILFF